MGKELFETLPDVLDAKLLASALSISKAGAYQLLNRPDFPTLQVGGRKLVTKQKLALWMEQHTNTAEQAGAGKENSCRRCPVNTASMSAALPFITISTSATPAR